MNVSQIRSTSNNGMAGYDNDALLNPTTLEVISMGPLFTSSGTLAFTVPSQAVALAFNWPSQPRGYSLIIYTRAQYKQRFIDFLNYYNGTNASVLEAWEVGNEVNGSWLSAAIPNKIADAALEVRNRQPNAKTVLTLFWQINTDTKANSMFNWARTNLPASTCQNIDMVLISQYAEQAPMGLAFDQVMNVLHSEFPSQQIGLGELGYWIPDQQYWWAFDQNDPLGAGLRGTAAQYYPASFAYPSSVGGVFWWNFITEFTPDPQLQDILSNLRDQIFGSGQPTPTPGPTSTPTSTPTATSTPTRTPTPTATSSSVGNTHSGTWAAKGILPATANFKDLYQENITVTANANYVANLWIKGTGSIKLNIWNNSWGTNIANTQCTASGAWTQCTLSFNIGSRTKLVFDLETAYNGPGTVYIDDTFLGPSGGANKLSNPGFESGNTIWQTNSSGTWSIVNNP